MAELKTKLGDSIFISEKSGYITGLMEVASKLDSMSIERAVEKFVATNGEVDSFKDSTSYDLLVDKQKYPPKAIFALALSDLLGVEVRSHHFKGGKNSECFQIFKRLGFDILEKVRSGEYFDYSNLDVGTSYTKLEIFEKAKVYQPESVRDIAGVTRFKNCVVLFVTLQKDGRINAHKYNDRFLLDGQIFQWESQNNNTPATPHMEMIIKGDPVVLFARVREKVKSKTEPFVFVGELSYMKHSYSNNISKPVEVIFNVSDYQNKASTKLLALYNCIPDVGSIDEPIDSSNVILREKKPPRHTQKPRKNNDSSGRANKIDWADRDERNRQLGLAGEELVIKHEKQRLKKLGRNDLAKMVVHTAAENDGAGYDVRSFDDDGKEKYIEVKTTRSSAKTPFFISKNEVAISQKFSNQYWIYRVYNLKENSGVADFFSIQGPVDSSFELEPQNFKASLKRPYE